MKISVLIAASRAGAHLAEALASVRAQSHTDWEAIVADYGPPDQTEKIVRDLNAGADQPIHYHRLDENTTVAVARNRLLELATGDPVAFLDPHDTWTPRHLTNAAHTLAANADIAVSDFRTFDPKNSQMLGEVASPAQLIANPTRTLFARNALASISCVVFRRSLIARAGVFDERFRLHEGRDFWLRCALAGARFAATHRATCQCPKPARNDAARDLLAAEHGVLFYDKHRDLAAVPAALRRRLLAASLVAHGRLLRSSDPARAARCFWRAWSLQPVYVQTLGQFALTGWRSGAATPPADPRRAGNPVGNESAS